MSGSDPSGPIPEAPPPPDSSGWSGLPWVWAVPIVALVIAGWLGYRALVERGPTIAISFETAEGIETGRHGAPLTLGGRGGVLHGAYSAIMQDEDGQILEAHSISAGLDYPGIGPEHSWLKELGRVEYVSATDNEALTAFQLLCKLEGIIPALEPAHALAHVTKLAPALPKDNLLVMNLCGRGDKDVFAVAERLGMKI